MSAKASRRLRTALVVVLVLAALYSAYRYTLHRVVETKLDELRKQGYPVTLVELDKWYPQPPPGQNAADVYTEAFKHYVKLASDTNLPIVGDARMPPRDTLLPTEMLQGIVEYLARNQQSLALFHKAATMRSCRYQSDESDVKAMFESLIKRFGVTRAGTRMLYLEAVSASATGDTQRAVDSIGASVALAESVRNPPGQISYYVEYACLGLSFDALQQALSRIAFNDRQLVDLAKTFHQVETDDGFVQAIIGERARANETWQELRTGRGSAKDLIVYKDEVSNFDRAVAMAYRPLGFIDLDYLARLQFFNEFLLAMDTPFPGTFQKVDSLDHKHALFNLLPVARMEAELTEKSVKHKAHLQAQLRAVGVALSVERYRVANGTLPESLDALIPKFLTAVPTDPFDGQPLRYRKLVKGYVVYSVGEDENDDGGVEPGPCFGPGTDITFTVER
jgi:hypothetical protein